MATKEVKTIDIMREHGVKRAELYDIIDKLGIKKFKGEDKTWCISAEDAEVVEAELNMPEPFQVMHYQARGIKPCNNKRFFYCTVKGFEGKWPVLIPRKLQGRLLGKEFTVEKIEDETGITFRHSFFSEREGYERC